MEAARAPDRRGGLETQEKCSLVYMDADDDSWPPALLQSQDPPTEARNKESNDPTELQSDTQCKLSLVCLDHRVQPRPYFPFQELPPELRFMVWENLLPKQRFIRAQTLVPELKQANGQALPRDVSLKEVRIVFDLDSGIPDPDELAMPVRQPILSQICQESRAFLQEHAKMVFSRGPQEPGLWWLPDTDVLWFKKIPQEDRKTTRLQSLQGLEHIKHISMSSLYAPSISYLVGCHPEACLDGPNEQADAQMLQLGLRSSVDASQCGKPRFYAEFFHGLRVLTIQDDYYGDAIEQDSDDDDCMECAMSYHSSGRFHANRCLDAYSFHLGDTSIDDALGQAMCSQGYAVWDEITFWSQINTWSLHFSNGPTIATREGLTEAADQLSWFDMRYWVP